MTKPKPCGAKSREGSVCNGPKGHEPPHIGPHHADPESSLFWFDVCDCGGFWQEGAFVHAEACEDEEDEPFAGTTPGMTDAEVRDLMLTAPASAYELGRLEGAATIIGILGMGFGIRQLLSKSHYGHPSAWVCDHIPDCKSVGIECGPDCICGAT